MQSSTAALTRKPFLVRNLLCILVALAVIAARGGLLERQPWDRVIDKTKPPRLSPQSASPARPALIEDPANSSKQPIQPQQRNSGGEELNDDNDDRRRRFPSWFLSYMAFHRDALSALRNSSTSSNKKHRYKSLIWICRDPSPAGDRLGRRLADPEASASKSGVCGGTGDRIGGILHALFMAVCTNRLFFIDWQYPSSLDGFLEPNHLQWNVRSTEWFKDNMNDAAPWSLVAMDDYENRYLLDPDALPTNQTTIEVRTNIWSGQIHDTSCMRNYISRFESTTTNGASSSSWTSEDYFRVGFEALFRWSDTVRENTERVRGQLNLVSSTSPIVAIHLRTGLGETFQDLVLPTAEADVWPLYYQCAQRVQVALSTKCGISLPTDGRGDGIRVPMYLATDAAAVRQHFAGYGDPSVRFVNETPVYHLDRTVRSRLGTDVDAAEAELQVWTDLQLLVESSCLVYTDRSKYSRLGLWLHRPLSARQRNSTSSLSNHSYLPERRPRCAFTFNQCRDRDVQRVMAELNAEELCHGSSR